MAERRPTSLLELVFAPTLWLLRDPSRRGKTRFLGVVFVLMGLGQGTATAVSLADWVVDIDNPKITMGTPGPRYSRWQRTWFTIEVEGGLRYNTCTGADYAISGPQLMAYDPDNPERCRKADRVGKLSYYEWELVLSSFSDFAIGALLLFIRDVPWFTRKQPIAHALLLLFLPFQVALAIFSYELKHSDKHRSPEPTQVFHGG